MAFKQHPSWSGPTSSLERYLTAIGVDRLPPATSPFDPGYDPVTLEAHLEQSAHLIGILKLSMACWQITDERATRRKLAAARKNGIRTVTGAGPFEVAVQQGALPQYLDLCAELGFDRIECGTGFTDMDLSPADVMRMAGERGLEVQFELGKKHGGPFSPEIVGELVEQGRRWLDAGATQLIIEGRESAHDVGLFGSDGTLDRAQADRFQKAFGFDVVCFEAPTKSSQFALLDHFGPRVHLCNVRLEELLRVEIYRRGLHSDAFGKDNLKPRRPAGTAAESNGT